MSAFNGSLIIQEVKPGKLWRLIQQITYEVDYEGSKKYIIVPRGFETDGATIPFPIKTFLAVWGTYGRAAVVHDYLYSLLRKNKPHIYAETRKQADLIFKQAMKPLGTPWWLRNIMYLCVRLFGWRYL